MKMKLISSRIRSTEELSAIEEKFPDVCGPSPIAYAARYGLKLSKPYVTFLRQKSKQSGNGSRKTVQARRKLVAG